MSVQGQEADLWFVVHSCSHLPNASQWEAHEVAMVTHSAFGKSEVESRLNVTREFAQYHTLECVASSDQEEAFTLFSISGRSTHTGDTQGDTQGDTGGHTGGQTGGHRGTHRDT